MKFLNIRVALDFKSTPLKTFLKNLDLPELWLFPLHQVGMSFYWLFGTFHVFAAGALSPSSFEPSSSNSSFSSSLTGCSQRTLVSQSANALGHFFRSNPNWKDSCGWLMCRANWQSQPVRYFLRPTVATKLSCSRKENLREGTKTPRVDLLANTIDGVRTANSHASWTNKDRQAPCAISFSPHKLMHRRCPPWKNVWSPTCPLNGSFQLPNCPLKRMFHSPNGIF